MPAQGTGLGYTPPQTTGNELLAYKGNADNAGGFDTKGYEIGNSSMVPLDQTMKQLNGQLFQWNTMRFQQAVSDRDASLKIMADPALSADFDVLDKDRPELNKQLLDIKQQFMDNPNLVNDAGAFIKMRDKINKFKQMAQNSKSRQVEASKIKVAAAAEQNQAERNKMLAHLNDQVDKGVDHVIDPYNKTISYDPLRYFGSVSPTEGGEYTGGVTVAGAKGATGKAGKAVALPGTGGEYRVDPATGVAYKSTSYETPQAALDAPFQDEVLLADNAKGFQDLSLIRDLFQNGPMGQDDNNWSALNNKIKQINADKKYSISDPRHLQELAIKDENTGKWLANPNVKEFGRGLRWAHQYNAYKSEAIDPEYNKSLHIIAQTKKELAAAALDNTKQGTERSHAKLYDALAIKALKDGNLADTKAGTLKKTISSAAEEAQTTFTTLSKNSKFQTVSQTNLGEKAVYKTAFNQLKEQGVTDDWLVSQVGKNLSVIKMTSEPEFELNKKTKKYEFTGATKKAAYNLILKSPDGDNTKTLAVGINADGTIQKVVNLHQAPGEIIKYDARYDQGANTIKLQDAANQILHEQGGSDDGGDETVDNSAEASQPVDIKGMEPVELNGKTYYTHDNNTFYTADGTEVKE